MSSRKSPRHRREASELLFEGTAGPDTKVIVICQRVAEVVGLALATATNPVLRELSVVEVMPARGLASLRVVIGGTVEAAVARVALGGAQGYLRSEVASELNRKATPALQLEYVPMLPPSLGGPHGT